MNDQSLGTARVDLVVNTDQFHAEVNRAKNLGASIGPEFEKSMQTMSASQRRATTDALRLAQQTGKTRDEIKLISLAARGAAPQALDELRKSIVATREETAKGAKEFNKYGVSQAQYAAALRGTPAQLTDIMVSLQGGQAPLTVLLQQGGQLRDMFGGLVPAARALGTAALGLVSPFSAAAAFALALGVAFVRGSSEAEAYTKALAESGNVLGETADSLGALAARTADAAGSQGRAAEALTAIVSTGKVARSALEDVTEATAVWASATGRDASEVASVFARLADEPTKAAATLNEQYHFLTASVHEQIRALEEQGKKEDAASLAQTELARALKSRADDVKESAGTLERAWSSLASVARGAWDAMLNIGRDTPTAALEAQAERIQGQVSRLQFSGGFTTTESGAAFGDPRLRAKELRRLSDELADIQDELNRRSADSFTANARAEAATNDKRRIEAQEQIQELIKAGRTKEQVRESELRKLREQLKEGLVTQEQYEQASKAIAEKYKDTNSGGRSMPAADRLLAQYNEAHAALQAQLVTQEKLGTWAKKRIEFEQQLVDLKERRSLTVDQKSIIAREDELRAALKRNEADERAIELAQERAKLAALQVTLASRSVTDSERYTDVEGAFGLGRKEQGQLQERTRLYRDYRRDLDRITAQRNSGDISEDSFKEQSAAFRMSLDERIAAQESHFARLGELEGDWLLGARGAMADYVDEARNVAGATRDALTSAFSGAENALVNFVTTGKASFKDFASSIIADLARIAARQAIVGMVGSLMGAISGGISSGPGFVKSGPAIGGAGSGMGGSLQGFLSVAGGRARGGPTAANSLYQVNELGPELYTESGRTYLMSGARGGFVTPITPPDVSVAAGRGGSPLNLNLSVVVNSDGSTQREGDGQQFGSALADAIVGTVQSEIARSWEYGGISYGKAKGFR